MRGRWRGQRSGSEQGCPGEGALTRCLGAPATEGGGGAGEEEEEGEAEELGEEEEVEGRGAGDTRARAPPCGGAEAAEGSREEEQRVPAAFVPCRGLFCK